MAGALLLPEGIRDLAALRAAAEAIPGLLVVDIKAETEALLDHGIGTALRWGAAGGLLVLLLLGAGRGVAGAAHRARAVRRPAADLRRTPCAGRADHRLPPAALLLAGVGMDYALFIPRTGGGDAGRGPGRSVRSSPAWSRRCSPSAFLPYAARRCCMRRG